MYFLLISNLFFNLSGASIRYWGLSNSSDEPGVTQAGDIKGGKKSANQSYVYIICISIINYIC